MPQEREPIHSGHFMTSHIHTDPPLDDDDEDVEVIVDVLDDEKQEENNRSNSTDRERREPLDEKPVTFYKFGPKKTQSIAIDVSLNKLNKCIKVAYNKMTTPKWKDFKGLRLHWRQRIRLNNVIWRAYYLEFGRPNKKPVKKKAPYCYFSVPDDDTTHVKIEGSIIEGMYWKRRMEAVCAEYKRWRHYTKTKRTTTTGAVRRKRVHSETQTFFAKAKKKTSEPPMKQQRSQTPKNTSTEYFDVDEFDNVFTDSLFETLSQPYMFPNPRELSDPLTSYGTAFADIMQPQLLSLQPSLEEIMASFEEFDSGPCTSSSLQQPSTSNRIQQEQMQPMPPPMPSRVANQQHMQQQQQQQQQQQAQHETRRRTTSANMAPSAPNRPPQDYAAASMLVDYSNQQASLHMPTRQSSSITSHMHMMSSQAPQPQYSTAVYSTQSMTTVPNSPWRHPSSFLPSGSVGSPASASSIDYMPQFAHASSTQAMLQSVSSRGYNWLDSPLAIPSAPSPLAGCLGQPATPGSLPIIQNQLITDLCSPRLRSPVVRSATDIPRLQEPLLGASHSTTSTLLTHLQQQSTILPKPQVQPVIRYPQPIVNNDEAKIEKFVPPTLSNNKTDWLNTNNISSKTTSNLSAVASALSNSLIYQQKAQQEQNTQQHQQPVPEQRTTSSSQWKLASIEPTAPVYPTSLSFSSVSPTQPTTDQSSTGPSRVSSSHDLAALDSKSDIVCKEEPLISAPPSVKCAPRSSRQVPADSTLCPDERKRILHLHAEQNRRSALKDGFESLMAMIPDLYAGGVKPTNAVVLAKSADYVRRLLSEKDEKAKQQNELQNKIARLNARIATLQANLPSTSGVSSSKMDPRSSMEAFYDRYTKEMSRRDWRFWVMAKMLHPIAVGNNNSFAAQVAPDGSAKEEVSASCADWIGREWRANELRPLASSLLVQLATNTTVLSDPSSLADYVNEQLKNPVT